MSAFRAVASTAAKALGDCVDNYEAELRIRPERPPAAAQGGSVAQRAVQPPSTLRLVPVTKREAADTR